MDGDEPVYIYELPNEELKQAPAGFGRRFLAFAIDSALFYFVLFQIFFMIYASMAGIPVAGTPEAYTRFIMNNSAVYQKLVTGIIASGFVFLFYLVVSEKYFGATIGGHLMKLRVASTNQSELSFVRLVNRNITKSVLIPLLIIDMVPALFTEAKQRYTEIASNTKTVYVGKLELVYEGYA